MRVPQVSDDVLADVFDQIGVTEIHHPAEEKDADNNPRKEC